MTTELKEQLRTVAEYAGGIYKVSAVDLKLDKTRIYLGEYEIMYQIDARTERYQLKYDTSYDWLMPVAKKVKDELRAITNDSTALIYLGQMNLALTNDDLMGCFTSTYNGIQYLTSLGLTPDKTETNGQ